MTESLRLKPRNSQPVGRTDISNLNNAELLWFLLRMVLSKIGLYNYCILLQIFKSLHCSCSSFRLSLPFWWSCFLFFGLYLFSWLHVSRLWVIYTVVYNNTIQTHCQDRNWICKVLACQRLPGDLYFRNELDQWICLRLMQLHVWAWWKLNCCCAHISFVKEEQAGAEQKKRLCR